MKTTTITAGLNYGSISSRNPRVQYVQPVDSSGNVLMTATGGECIYESGDCARGIYDMNFEVLAFALVTSLQHVRRIATICLYPC